MKKPLKRFLFIFCVILLLGGGTFIWFNRQAMLTDAAGAGNLTAVGFLYLLGADLNGAPTDESGEGGEYALCAAVANGHEDVVRFFIQHHADLDIDFGDEGNPLALALTNYSMAELLLSNGANPRHACYGRPIDRNNWNPPLDDRMFNLLKKYDAPTPSQSKPQSR